MTSAFPLASGKQLGYRIDEVDHFLDRARSTYETHGRVVAPVTAAEIRAKAFSVKRRGYAARFVDVAMDRLEEVFFERERRARIAAIGEDAWWAEVQVLLSEVRGRLQRERGKRFRRRGWFATGYRRSQVDAFLDRAAGMLSGNEALATADVRSAVFHAEWRGYDEDQVDAFLDAIIEVMLSVR